MKVEDEAVWEQGKRLKDLYMQQTLLMDKSGSR